MSSRRLQDISSTHLQDMSSRHLRDVFSVTIFCLSRRLQDVLEGIKLLCWRRVENVFKANKCLLDSKVCEEMEILALSFCVKFPGLSSVLCFHSIKSSKSFFCNQSKHSSFSLVNGTKKGFHFLSYSSKLPTLRQSKKESNILQYFAISNVSILPKCSSTFPIDSLRICVANFTHITEYEW